MDNKFTVNYDDQPGDGVDELASIIENFGIEVDIDEVNSDDGYIEYEVKVKNKLAEAQEEYINFLDKHITALTSFAYVHSFRFSEEVIQEGADLRKKIEDLKPKL